MKNTNICPKCKSTDVVRIPAHKSTSTSNIIQLNKWGTQYAYFDRYVCNGCGFMEHYVDVEDKSWQKWFDQQLKENSLDSDFV